MFQQRVCELMVDVINQLPFPVPTEKQEWLDTASQWRLPYWDWGLRSTAGHIPDLFTMLSIAIRQPLDAENATPKSVTVTNPLARYQLQTGWPKVPTAMGTLPPPYKVDDVVLKNGTRLPVSGTCRCELLLTFYSGLNARAQAVGASRMEWIKTIGCSALTIGRPATMPLKAISTRPRGLRSIAKLSPTYVIEYWLQDTPPIGRLLLRLEKTESRCQIRTGPSISLSSTFITVCM